MIKYIPEDTSVVFGEIPDEITLAINISNCQNNCVGCHSPYLRKNIGEELTEEIIDDLIAKNAGITCICFMGEGNDSESLQNLIKFVCTKHRNLKIGLYSGRNAVGEDFYWRTLDYLKIGAFMPQYGPLNKPTTNQKLYRIIDGTAENITSKFWKHI